MKHRFYVDNNQNTICVSSFAGKAVRGIAKCNTESGDVFDEEKGKKLSQLRCDYKIAMKRVLRARQKHAEATKIVGDAKEYQAKMQKYYDESFAELVKLNEEINSFEATL